MAEEVSTGLEDKEIRRKPFIPISIKNLTSEYRKVCIVGTIISKNPELYSFLLDDGTSTVLVLTNNVERFKELKENDFVRVFGRVWGEGEEIELQADIIQDFNKVDKELWRRVFG